MSGQYVFFCVFLVNRECDSVNTLFLERDKVLGYDIVFSSGVPRRLMLSLADC